MPVLFLHGTADDSVPYGSGLLAFQGAHPPKFFVTLQGSGHSPPYTGDSTRADAQVVTKATIDFFDRYLKDSPGGLVHLHGDATVAGVASIQEAP